MRARFVGLLTVQRGTSRPLTPVAGDHRFEVVDRRVHVHGAHTIDVAVGRLKGLDALLEVAGQIQQPATRR
ncbi:MAG TPA: hypothetical protein VFQ03_02990 [Candidatus Binatia bacterium]|nr:hypothetical protein [Candidatus Binatia bacterium]